MIVRIKWTPIRPSRFAPLAITPSRKGGDSGFTVHARKAKLHPGSHVLLSVLLLAPALPVSTISDVPPRTIARPTPKPAPTETLASFVRRKNFVEPYNLPEIEQSASQASIPPSLIVCIEFVESSGGKYYDAETNNPLGWKNGKASFPSVRAAIRHVSQELGSGRWYAGKTLEEKLRVYNPRPYYAVKVLGCMSQLP